MRDKILSILIGVFLAVSMYFILEYLFYNTFWGLLGLLSTTLVVEFMIYTVLEKLLYLFYKQEFESVFSLSMLSAFLMIIVEARVTYLKNDLDGIAMFIFMFIVWFGIAVLRFSLFLIKNMKKSS